MNKFWEILSLVALSKRARAQPLPCLSQHSIKGLILVRVKHWWIKINLYYNTYVEWSTIIRAETIHNSTLQLNMYVYILHTFVCIKRIRSYRGESEKSKEKNDQRIPSTIVHLYPTTPRHTTFVYHPSFFREIWTRKLYNRDLCRAVPNMPENR